MSHDIEVNIEEIDTFTMDIERDIRRRCLIGRMLMCVKQNTGFNELYTPIKVTLRKVPDGLATTTELSRIRIENQHAKHIGEELVRANVVLESREEKDKRIDDLKLTIMLLEERIKFFENVMYSTMNVGKEDIERIRLIRGE